MNRLTSALSEVGLTPHSTSSTSASPSTTTSDPTSSSTHTHHRNLYRSSSLAPTEVDLSTAISTNTNPNTPFLVDSPRTPLPSGGPFNSHRRNDRDRHPGQQDTGGGGPLDYFYDDPRTPYFHRSDRTPDHPGSGIDGSGGTGGKHGWLHPLPGGAPSTSVLYQHQLQGTGYGHGRGGEPSRSGSSRVSGLGFSDSLGTMDETGSSHLDHPNGPTSTTGNNSGNQSYLSAQGQQGGSTAGLSTTSHRDRGGSMFSLNEPSTSSSTRFSSSSSSSAAAAGGGSHHSYPHLAAHAHPHRPTSPDKFVKAIITSHPQHHIPPTFPFNPNSSTSFSSPGSGSGSGSGSGTGSGSGGTAGGKRLSRAGGSVGSITGGPGASGSGGKGAIGLALKGMARGPEDQVVVAGNETLRILEVTPPHIDSKSHLSRAQPQAQSIRQSSTSKSSPSTSSHPIRLGSGPGGYKIDQILDLWKGIALGGVGSTGRGGGGRAGGSAGSQGGGVAAGKTVNAVDWGVGSSSKKVLTACSNGNLMVFDVEQGRLDREIPLAHTRSILTMSMNKVVSQGHLVLTAGADGFAKIWDLRQSSNKTAVGPVRHPAPIVSLTFAPPGVDATASSHSYLLGLENGSIYRYDRRMSSRSTGRMTAAHRNKAVMALDWKEAVEGDGNSGNGGWLASAGLDKTVKIWDMSLPECPVAPFHVIQTPYPVRRIAWRPGHATEIAVLSSPDSATPKRPVSMTPDTVATAPELNEAEDATVTEEARLEIWDVRRGYLSKYLLGKALRHTEAAGGAITEISWADAGALQTTYTNGSFVQHDLRQHFRPLDHLPKQVLGCSPRGETTVALDRFVKGEIPFDDLKEEHLQLSQQIGVRPKAIADKPFQTRQACLTISLPFQDEEVFGYLAAQYKQAQIGVQDRLAVCTWNANVAEEVDRDDAAHAWKLLRILLETETEFAKKQMDMALTPLALKEPEEVLRQAFGKTQLRLPSSAKSMPDRTDLVDPLRTPGLLAMKAFLPVETPPTPAAADRSLPIEQAEDNGSSGSTTPPAAMSMSMQKNRGLHPTHIEEIRSKLLQGVGSLPPDPVKLLPTREDGDSESDEDDERLSSSILATTLTRKSRPQFMSPPVHEEGNSMRRVSPAHMLRADRRRSSGLSIPDQLKRRLAGKGQASAGTVDDYAKSRMAAIEHWLKALRKMLEDIFEKALVEGDIQLASSLILVAPSSFSVSLHHRTRIVEAYLELLDRHRLAVISADIRSKLDPFKQTTLVETSIYLRCGRCRKAKEPEPAGTAGSSAWFCGACRRALTYCVICRMPVKGIWQSCHECGHSGHFDCLRSYIAAQKTMMCTPIAPYKTPSKRSDSPVETPAWTAARRRGSPSPAPDSERRFVDQNPPQTNLVIGEGYDNTQKEGEGILCPSGCGCRCNMV